MTRIRPKDGVALPSVANPAPEDAVRRDWIEANIAGGGGSKHVVQDEGTDLPAQARLNFTGTGVAATDDPVNGQTDVVIPGDYAPGSHVGSRDGHPLATTTASGFMAGADKAKLDGLSAQAVGAFHAYKSVDQAIASGTITKVAWGAELYDVSAWFDTTNSRYIPQVEGAFRFSTTLFLTPGVDGKRVAAYLYKNGVLHKYVLFGHTGSANNYIAGGTVTALANGTTDYFEIYMFHDFGSTPSILGGIEYTHFAAEHLGRTS